MPDWLKCLLLGGAAFSAHADMCANLSGNWEGNWLDQTAKLWISPMNQQQFSGGFILADGSVGKLLGQCTNISEHEAYLKLQEDAPDYNPCRGSIVFYRNALITHFYCFNPNQSGYFNKAL